MIQKAIVESVENDYQVKVRIPKYDKMSTDGFTYDELSTSIICSSPGALVNYSAGDIVLVGFENDEIDKPVILGLLYTESNPGTSTKFPEISDKLLSMDESLNKLVSSNSYIHIKYSNDGGITFTSLYDYSDESYDFGQNYYYASGIQIDPKSTYIMWNIVTPSGVNSSDKVYITTTLVATNPDGTVTTPLTFDTTSIDIPSTFNFASSVEVSYTLKIIDGQKSDYNISLFTDKNELGSVEGDYIGFYYSTNYLASSNPMDYSWASIKVRLQKFIDEAFNSLLSRVQINERYLYGMSKEDTINTGVGLSSAVSVSQDEFDISGKPLVTLSLNDNIQVDTLKERLKIGNFDVYMASNGHFRLQAKLTVTN